MVDQNLVTAKLSELSERIQRIRQHRPETAAGYKEAPEVLDLVSFNLMLAVQLCLDVASHLIADEGWPPAPTLAEHFTRLREQGVLTRDTESALAKATGLRNVVAHTYAKVEPAKIHEAATRGLTDLERFSHEVSRWLGR